MENKYYQPSIEEFHIGFRYEMKILTIDMCKVPKDVDIRNILELKKYMEDNTIWINCEIHKEILNSINKFEEMLDNNEIRVKLLDQTDIEELGFKYTHTIKNNVLIFEGDYIYENTEYHQNDEGDPKYTLYLHNNNLSEDGLYIEIDNGYNYDDNDCYFKGTIKNYNELERLLKQIGVK